MAESSDTPKNIRKEEETKKPMTDEERLELAKKLDKELDEFINSLPKRKNAEGTAKDAWEEELEKHPFFMKKHPEPGDDLHPLYEGLQRLKYDPDENTPKELAISYKEDGNFNFKHGNYRLAILAYTEGVKAKCGDPDMESSLLNNRSAAHYFLKNYRSSLRDSELALKIKPEYTKAEIRAANCCFYLNQHEKCLEYCERILGNDRNNEGMLRLKKDCIAAKKGAERDVRKKKAGDKKKAEEEALLIKAILDRNINVDIGEEPLSLKHLEVHFPALVHHPVHFDDENNLVWPVAFLYPEYQTMDFTVGFPENDTFANQLFTVFETTPEWDRERKYRLDNLNVYYENARTSKVYAVEPSLRLKEILREETFLLRGGTPAFIIFSKGSAAEKSFLEKY